MKLKNRIRVRCLVFTGVFLLNCARPTYTTCGSYQPVVSTIQPVEFQASSLTVCAIKDVETTEYTFVSTMQESIITDRESVEAFDQIEAEELPIGNNTYVEEIELAEEYSQPESSQYVYLTDTEINRFAALIYLEGGCESLECQKAIGSVILNRYTSGQYGTLDDVIYAPSQFSPASLVLSTTPTQTQLDIVNELITYGPTIPQYVTFFRAGYYHAWGNLVPYVSYDNTYFSYSPSMYAEYNNQ